MTIIAWDGVTLAADRRSTMVGLIFSVTKLRRGGDSLAGFSGRADGIGKYAAWIEAGSDPKMFPEQDKENPTYLLVIRPGPRIERYETTGWPIVVEERFHATGSGRDFAMAAMHLGLDAVKGVEVACALSEDCGNGIDTLQFEGDYYATDRAPFKNEPHFLTFQDTLAAAHGNGAHALHSPRANP